MRVTADGKQRDIGIGGYPAVSLADARDRAAELRAHAAEGDDPLVAARRSDIPTFAAAARIVHEMNLPRWRNEHAAREWLASLERYAFESLGDMPLHRIQRADVLSVLLPIWTTKPETARRLRQRVRKVLDLGSRRLLGYQMSDRIDTRLVADALDMASAARSGRTAGIVFHSDRGSQYLAGKFRTAVKSWGMNQSVGRVGSSTDNAVAEAFFSTLKRELVHQHRYTDRDAARRSIFERLARCNTHPRHTSLGCLTPDQYEHHYRQTTGPIPALTT